ncbi:hypothetical protein HDU92_006274 [Lobulomyces angularis]|nr:hypothetical protein HDU92_006274 [Lobulomyces angularis]
MDPGLIKSYFRQIIKKVLERKHGAIADSSKANTSVHQPTILLQVTDFKSTENDEFKDFLESKDDFLSSEI